MESQLLVREGWVYSLGTYFPRSHREHWQSAISQAVLWAKRGRQKEIEGFAVPIARFLNGWLPRMEPHIFTYVPGEPSPITYLFSEMDWCSTRQLANAIFRHLDKTEWWTEETLLTPARPKFMRQRDCKSTAQRHANVQGQYRVKHPDAVKGQNIVIVDDIVTSGATMDECKRLLEDAGAKSVMGVALARTVHKAWWPIEQTALSC